MSRCSSRLAALLALVLIAGSASARDEFQERFQKGQRLYLDREYGEAITEFQAAYQIRQLPRLLFNIAQAHRKLGHAREALLHYEHYLRVAGTLPPEHKAEVDEYVAQMKALLQVPAAGPPKEAQPEPPPAGEAPPSSAVRQEPDAPKAAPSPLPIAALSSAPSEERKRRPVWRIATGAVALAAGGLLVGFGASGLSVNGQCVSPIRPPAMSCMGGTYNTLGVGAGLVGAGAAVVVAGAVLIALPGPRSKRQVLLSPTGGGLLLGGTF